MGSFLLDVEMQRRSQIYFPNPLKLLYELSSGENRFENRDELN